MRRIGVLGSILGLVVVLAPGIARARTETDISFDVPATGEVVGRYLPQGVYVVKVYGTVLYDTTSLGPSYADAECTSPSARIALDNTAHAYNLYPSPLSGWQTHRYVMTSGGTDLLDLEVDAVAPEWAASLPTPVGWDPAVGGPGVDGGCNENDHTYEYVLTSIGDNHTFRIYDPASLDNVGELHISITQIA